MADGALGSDHINYLILRYLQEAGHAKAAKALYQDWHRPAEYHDPERLPFAPRVKQFELVSIIQDGLFLDQMQAEVRREPPRFSLTDATGPSSEGHSISDARQQKQQQHQQHQQQHQHQPARRRSSQTQQQPQHHHHHHQHQQRFDQQDDFPMPAPKRARKSNGDDSTPQVNGDAMDIDAKTPVTAGEDGRSDEGAPTDTDRAMSDAVQSMSSPPAPPPPPPRPLAETSSAGTQTDQKLKAKRSETVYLSVDKDDASIMHAIWNPVPASGRSLLTIGESICRFYEVPPQAVETQVTANGDATHPAVNQIVSQSHQGQTHHYDVEDMPPGSIATAATWHPSGRYATCSLEIPRHINAGEHTTRAMFDTGAQKAHGNRRPYSDTAYLNVLQRQSPTLTTALRYNEPGSRLLSVSVNLKRGLLEIWEGPSEEPIAVKIFGKPIYDAVWASDDEIVVCGAACIEVYKIDSAVAGAADDAFTTTGARNLTLQSSYTTETEALWEKVRYDAQHRVIAAVSVSSDAIIVLGQSPDNRWLPLPGFPPTDSSAMKQISALAFEHAQSPVTDASADAPLSPRRLATTHHTGAINVFAITNTSCTRLQTLYLASGPAHQQEAALALSWSPDGMYLAAASEDIIKVWDPAFPYAPVLSWRASPEHWTQSPDEGGDLDSGMGDDVDVQTVDQPALAWDAEGGSLVFANGRKMAVVRLLS